MKTTTAKVALVKCTSYDRDTVLTAVRRGVDLMGGLSGILGTNKKVVLNPNALMGAKPEKHATTNASVMWAVGKLFKDAGYDTSYGDGPGGVLPVKRMMRTCGLGAVAEELGIPLADFANGKWVSHPEGLNSKKLYIANAVLESDAVVSLPKLKTHGMVRYTGAIKNSFGCLPGMVKGEAHARFPDPFDFSRLLVDVAMRVRPKLFVMDAVIAMEGNGPMSGTPKNLGVIMVSTDPVAMDAVACRIINLDPGLVPAIVEADMAGLGVASDGKIELLGDSLSSFVDTSFKVQRTPLEPMPQGRIRRMIRNWSTPRPSIDRDRCKMCGECIQACPVSPKAVNWEKGNRRRPPVYTYRDCIRCFCCQEMCPHRAIKMYTPVLRRLLPPVSYTWLVLVNLRRFIRRKLGRL